MLATLNGMAGFYAGRFCMRVDFLCRPAVTVKLEKSVSAPGWTDRTRKEEHMPELPEVETLCRQLRQRVPHAKIKGTFILDSKLGKLDNLKGRGIASVTRLGKRIVFGLDDGRSLEIHLRMTGRLLWQEKPDIGEKPPHSRFILDLTPGRIIIVDPRRFATLSLVADVAKGNAAVDALKPGCPEALKEKGCNRSRSIKSFLMDQSIIGGIGNIYACEILYRAGLNPLRRTADLTSEDWRRVESAMVEVLSKAVVCRGTSISDWRDLFGCKGEYQKELRVYGREGKKCPHCGGIIQRVRLLGRGTWFCPNCQA